MTIQMSEKAYAAGALMEGAFAGDRRDKAKFFEQLTSGEIPVSLLQAPLTARLITAWGGIEDEVGAAAASVTVDDFTLQSVYRLAFDDDSQVLEVNEGKARVKGDLPRIGELGEYQTFGFSSSNVGYRAYKNGIKFGLSWEAIINGRSLSLIERAVNQMARMARNTRNSEVFGQYVTSSSLNTANLLTGGATPNVIPLNPALSLTSLQQGLALAATHKVNNQLYPISGKYTLLVPPALEQTARNILSITEITTQNGTGSGSTLTKAGNPVAGKLDLQVSTTLSRINSGSGAYWFLIPDLNQTEGYRPEIWTVRGNEAPKVFVKSTTNADPTEGDFDHDAYETKLRSTDSGVNTGMLGVIASNGSGS